MAKYSINTVEFCGKKREWKDCTNKDLRDYQKEMDKLVEKVQPALDEIEDLQESIDENNSLLQDVNDGIKTLQSKENMTDKDSEDIMKMIYNRKTIRKDIRDAKAEIKAIDRDNKEQRVKMEERLPVAKAELISKMVDISPEEYLEKSTEYDEFIAEQLSTIRIQLLAGSQSKDIEKIIKKQLEARFR